MADPNKQSEPNIDQLYNQRKANNLAPRSIKKYILSKREQTINPQKVIQKIGFIAATACTLVLFGLISVYQIQSSEPTLEANFVTIHTLNQNTSLLTNQRSVINQKYTQAYQAYLKQQRYFAQHHLKQASLEFVENGWRLKTCEDDPLLISNELITALSNINQVDQTLASGDVVNIAFAQNGIVLSINSSSKPLVCT
ncbi:hypothetical protein [Paraglaciecola sp.]|uniref:hypothetical protein n=1 Tax=Paraglaciecola sp. TaxID=1920173 RepID=UPI003EF3B6E7